MAVRRRTPGVVTNAEGFEIPQPGARRKKAADRGTFVLMGVLQIFAVAIIARQLKAVGLLPAWVNTDLNTVRCLFTAADGGQPTAARGAPAQALARTPGGCRDRVR